MGTRWPSAVNVGPCCSSAEPCLGRADEARLACATTCPVLSQPRSQWVFLGPGHTSAPPCSPRASCCFRCSQCRCLSEIEAKYDKKMKMLRDELDLRRKTEVHEVEERKNSQISALMQRHEEAFTDIKNYYNDVTLNNLALINSLKVLPRAQRLPFGCP